MTIFERLAGNGTAASKARDAEAKERREQLQQRRLRDAGALSPRTNPTKLQHLNPPQDQVDPLKIPTRTPTQKDEFFNRLATHETISSAAHHSPGDSERLSSPRKIASPRDGNAVYNRLYQQDTACSKAHHQKEDAELARSPKNTHPAPPPSLLKRLGEHDAASSPPIPIQMKLHIRSKEEKNEGKVYGNLNISQNNVRKCINSFHSGKISAHALAFDVITALFDRDFTPGPHWEHGSAKVEELDLVIDKTLLNGEEGEKFECFGVEKEAVLDWKGVYRVAKSDATIKISSGNLYVDEYSYFLTA